MDSGNDAYPPSAAAQIAERIRAAEQPFATCTPQAHFMPPTATPSTAQGSPALATGLDCNAFHIRLEANAAKKASLPGVRSRIHDPAAPDVASSPVEPSVSTAETTKSKSEPAAVAVASAPATPPITKAALLLPVRGRGDSKEAPAMLPLAARGGGKEAPPILPMPGRGGSKEVTQLLPMPGRGGYNQAPSLGLPGVASRANQQDASAGYVTDDVLTRRPKAHKPVPLRMMASHDSDTGLAPEAQHLLNGRGWARSFRNVSGYWQSGADSPISSGVSSLPMSCMASVISLQDDWTGITRQQRNPRRWDSDGSVRWAPEVLVQSWHRKLYETYQDYSMVNVLGEGRSGAVFLVQHKRSLKHYACKLLHKADHDTKVMRGEIEMLRRLDHPNIVRLYETNEDNDAIYLMMELCQGGDLFGRIMENGHLPEWEAQVFAQQMLAALAYCHKMGIVHRDVKPENLLLESMEPDCMVLKLCDFGVAARIRPNVDMSLDPEEAGQVNGSRPYMAPELFLHTWKSLTMDAAAAGQKFGAGSTATARAVTASSLAASDLWSSGVVIYVMLSGDLPFGDCVDAICSGDPPDFSGEIWRSLPIEPVDLIRSLLRPSIEERWTAKRSLRHEWLASNTGALSDGDADRTGGCSTGLTRKPNCVSPILQGAERTELAEQLLTQLRRWKGMNTLRRMCIAAVAKRIEADHPSQRLAQKTYRTFSNHREVMRCNELVQALFDALENKVARSAGGSDDKWPAEPSLCTVGGVDGDGLSAASDEDSTRGWPTSDPDSPPADKPPQQHTLNLQGPTLTGLHIRTRVKGIVKKMSKVSEEGSTSSSPPWKTGTGSQAVLPTASLDELQYLVHSLDGMKNGDIDYTLLVAALLPDEVFCEEQRTAEAFEAFDIRRAGGISPDCLRKTFQSKDADAKTFSRMMAEFDLNRDGVIDLEEFRLMLIGRPEAAAGASSCTASQEATSPPVACGMGCTPFGVGFGSAPSARPERLERRRVS